MKRFYFTSAEENGREYNSFVRSLSKKKLEENYKGDNIEFDGKTYPYHYSEIDGRKIVWEYRHRLENNGRYCPVCDKEDANMITVLNGNFNIVAEFYYGK